MSPTGARGSAGRFLSTEYGLNLGAFGLREWGLLSSIALMWGGAYFLIAVGLDAFGPAAITLGRLVLGALTLFAFPAARAQKIDREDRWRVWILGVIWMGIPWLLYPIAQQWIASSLAGMLSGAMPLFTGLFAIFLLRQLPGNAQVSGLLVGFAGVVAISWPATRSATATALGVALVVVATALYGLAANLGVPLQQKYGSAALMLRASMAAIVVVAPFGLYSFVYESSWSLVSFGAVVVLGVFGSGIAIIAMMTLIGLAGATRGAVAIYFIPVVAIFLGVLFRAETVEPIQIVGTVLVVVGAYLTSRRETFRRPRLELT